jgi:hypothetical protein
LRHVGPAISSVVNRRWLAMSFAEVGRFTDTIAFHTEASRSLRRPTIHTAFSMPSWALDSLSCGKGTLTGRSLCCLSKPIRELGQRRAIVRRDPSREGARGRPLYIAPGLLGLDIPPAAMPSGLRALHAWLDTWHGIGLIEQGLERQARDLTLTRYQDRWGAAVFVKGREHSITQGFGWQMTPWGAVQQAAFQALHRGRYWSDEPQVL